MADLSARLTRLEQAGSTGYHAIRVPDWLPPAEREALIEAGRREAAGRELIVIRRIIVAPKGGHAP